MDVSLQKRTASVIMAIAGLWVVLSPLFVSMSNAAIWNAVIAGGLLLITGISQMFLRSGAPSVVGVVLAVWLTASAFLFDQSTAAMWSLVVAGIVSFLASVWDEMATLSVGQHKLSRPV